MRRVRLLIGAAAAALLLATSAQGSHEERAPGARKPAPTPPATLVAKGSRLLLTTTGYRLSLSRENGALLELVDRRTGERLLGEQAGCAWAVGLSNGDSLGACAFARSGDNRFSYRWSRATATLTLGYEGGQAGRGIRATLTLTARPTFLDLRLALDTDLPRPVAAVHFPGDLTASTGTVRGVYTPTFLPGTRLLPGFFTRPRRNVERYPSRWAFADFEAADIGRGHVALYSVNPAPGRIAPVDVGVIHGAEPAPCSGRAFCLTHAFQTWIAPGAEWTSPLVRLRVGGGVEQSILAYRQENGIDRYPSLEAKLGERLATLARAPLIKADPWKGLPPFDRWGPFLRRLPSPSLLHPVAFQSRGHDEDFPDFLPPDPRWGSRDAFNRALDDARSLGHVVMPYLNVSWWDTQAPTVRALPHPLTPRDIAMQTSGGVAVTEQFGTRDGYIVSPYVPFVRERLARLMEEWRTDVPVECVFFDQIGARPWRRDFNPAAPGPLAYQDGWLAAFAPFRDRCLTTEDGWDRLAEDFVGFHGSALSMEREHRWGAERFGAGNWEPYPLALWLVHDKVLSYQHDLFEGTMTADPEVLLFNLAFGMILSYNWDGDQKTLDSPWLGLVGQVQRTLGPHYAGRPLAAFRRLAPDVTETVFGDYSLVANWSRTTPYEVAGHRLAPLGFVARTTDGRVLAGAFGDTWSGVTFPG